MLFHGLYEQVINKQLAQELDVATDKLSQTTPIDEAEASKVLTKYVSEFIEKGLDNVKDNGGNIQSQIELINKVISSILAEIRDSSPDSMFVDKKAELLLALLDKKNSIYALNDKAEVVRPETSISNSSLFTGAIHEPSMYTELRKEIVSSDRIDILVSFIKWSGLRLIIDELREFTMRGGILYVITTSYMGATDVKAIEELRRLPNTEIRVSYDTMRTRLHAKTYVFHRNTGFTTAYVGSSNLSNVAISSGLEWNVKITAKDLPETIKKITATIESYWNSSEFDPYDKEQKGRLESALKAERSKSTSDRPYLFDIRPYPYQQEILDKLHAEREVRGQHKNLVVAATGTGKTVVSAFDYRDFCKANPGKPNRLLFVAHREEILRQSLACFQGVLRNLNFGDLFVGSSRPNNLEYLFVSVQTFNSQALHEKTSPEYYDYIIIDEFHHAAAPTYQKLLSYYKPKILLGLTATPERMDGKDVLEYFDNRIAAEIRLPEAIDRKLLCPFQYFGVTDTVDLDSLRWVRGGYDRTELSNLYTLNRAVAERRADHIMQSLEKYVTDVNEVKGLGFCVSIEHARFMSEHFNSYGIQSIYLIGQSPDEERNTAKQRLISGEIRFIFVVDIYNEGVDIPEVNTVLFLRPTESLTIFLQQLGRGLRLSEGKECLTVLDFIGQANKKYSFEDKFAALLSNTSQSVQKELKVGFANLPKGCYVHLERKAKEYILDNIRNSITRKSVLLERVKTFESDSGLPLTLSNFLEYYHLDPRHIYKKGVTFNSLCDMAHEKSFDENDYCADAEKILFRCSTNDSRRWLRFVIDNAPAVEPDDWNSFSKYEQLMWQMFYIVIYSKPVEALGFDNVLSGICAFRSHKSVFQECIDLMEYRYSKIDFIDFPSSLGYDCPLDVHCTYTRAQIFAALDFIENYSISEGVKYLKYINTDVLLITLNKSDKYYSPSTEYNDYSINERLFHWQSQSTTSEESNTGRRYRQKIDPSHKILLFVRESKSDQYGVVPFTYLGPVSYLSHEGSRPMNIVWSMDTPIPAKFIKITNKLVAG